MLVAVNLCYGEFILSDRLQAQLYDLNYDDHDYRTSTPLVHAIERYGTDYCSTDFSLIGLAYVPNNATDWRIVNDDGYEDIIACVNGKLIDIEGYLVEPQEDPTNGALYI